MFKSEIMTEKLFDSTIEQTETPRHELIRLIRESGFESELTQSKFRDWLVSVQNTVPNTVPKSNNIILTLVEVDRECARLYFEAGLLKEALYTLETDLLIATKDKNIELYESIRTEIEILGLK